MPCALAAVVFGIPKVQSCHQASRRTRPEKAGIEPVSYTHLDVYKRQVERFAHLLVEPESRTNAADAVIGQLLAVIIETQPHPVGGCEKRLGNGIAAHHLGTELDACLLYTSRCV